ncbi:hypothetical protein D4764_01G0001740 [Takifugu flavidus]|uniref:Uncharacterized protein n=1 Tax=Takifugu flavidus TaxID=433684 RepID=A0A5C6PN33_9TELE|nr:hypothetical protein D4764_01G0001740 [Takifugu flavidus]
MEKTSTEDECVDSGAETAGSDYSPLSSTSKTGTDPLGGTRRFVDRYFPSLGLEPALGTCQKTSDHS